ncbi:MAG: T9SS type A sorting domain-containing protein [Melioribacteraceae bacterium]|nr:T9SS type A sorting domain-containing protein [Melioribacteraceae bacterium]
MLKSKSVMLGSIYLLFTFFTILFAQENGDPYTTDANTILLMHFDGNLENESTQSSNGVEHGNGITYSSNTLANLGQCLKLDNSNTSVKNYISIPHNDNLNLSESWTIEAWFYLSSKGINSGVNPTIVSKANEGRANYALWYHDSWGSLKGQFTNTDDKTTYVTIGDNTIKTGQWFHSAYIRDSENKKHKLIIRNENLEIIAQNEYQYDESQSIAEINANDLLIGSLSNLDNFYFDGYIDELRISNVVRDFSFKLNKTEITSENFIIYYDEENNGSANVILNQLQNKTDFYKKYFKYNFTDHSKVFSINICKNITEFNQLKPADLPDFETSYIHNEILYIIVPTTQTQLGYFDSFEQAAMHAFTKMFVDSEYNNNASEWMKYGFARHQAGMKSTAEQISTEISSLGRKPTIQEMNNWDQITSFDKYAFAYTLFQYIADVHSFNTIFNQIQFGNNSTSYGFRQFNTEAQFEKAWHYNLDLFYLRDSYRMEFQRETDHYYLYLVDEDLKELDQLASELEEFYIRFTNNMQMTLDHKIHVFFYPELCDFHYIQGNSDCPVGSVGEALSIDLAKFTKMNLDDPLMNSSSLAKHELTHVIHIALGFNHNPKWLLEGLASLMPDDLFTDEIINGSEGVLKEQINVGFSEVVSASGRYPTIDDFQSYEFVETYGNQSLMYYLLGSVMVDYLIKSSGYLELKQFILSDAADYTTLGFADKVEFMNSFYNFYEQNWKISSQKTTAKNIQNKLTIDGDLSEVDWSLDKDITGIYPFYQNWSNNTAKFGALWDNNFLYVAVKVLDNNLINNSIDDWNDGVEIFIDGDFNKATQYDLFDRQFKKEWNSSLLDEKNNKTNGVIHSVKNISGGYAVEIAIPWSNIGITPAADLSIGFDVSNIDNDGSKYQLIWSGNNLNNGTTINFGELKLLYNNAPIVSNIPNQIIIEGSTFAQIILDDFVVDTDNADSEINWTYTGNTDLEVTIDGNRIATVYSPYADWNGEETITFIATDPSGATNSVAVSFTLTSVNDGPVVSNFVDQTIMEGSNFSNIILDDFVSDPDNIDSEIIWSYIGNEHISVNISDNRIATISTPGENWYGEEIITFSAKDPENESSSKNIKFSVLPVNDLPIITSTIDFIEFKSDTNFSLNIWNLVSDIESASNSLKYSFTVASDSILFSYQDSSGVLLLSAIPNYGGQSKLFWRVDDNELSVEDTITIIVEKAVLVSTEKEINTPEDFVLNQNYPNPFNPSTSISFSLKVSSDVTLSIFNMVGQKIATIVNDRLNAGNYNTAFNAGNYSSGIYLYRITAVGIDGSKFRLSKKMILLQ